MCPAGKGLAEVSHLPNMKVSYVLSFGAPECKRESGKKADCLDVC